MSGLRRYQSTSHPGWRLAATTDSADSIIVSGSCVSESAISKWIIIRGGYPARNSRNPGQRKIFKHYDRVRTPTGPACSLADEDAALSWSTKFSQRLNLGLRCGDNAILLESFPLHADEKLDLKRDAQVSVEGAMDGGGFKRRGRLQSTLLVKPKS
jgi:hypothetical protein